MKFATELGPTPSSVFFKRNKTLFAADYKPTITKYEKRLTKSLRCNKLLLPQTATTTVLPPPPLGSCVKTIAQGFLNVVDIYARIWYSADRNDGPSYDLLEDDWLDY